MQKIIDIYKALKPVEIWLIGTSAVILINYQLAIVLSLGIFGYYLWRFFNPMFFDIVEGLSNDG